MPKLSKNISVATTWGKQQETFKFMPEEEEAEEREELKDVDRPDWVYVQLDIVELLKPIPFARVEIKIKRWLEDFDIEGELLVYQHARTDIEETDEWWEFGVW